MCALNTTIRIAANDVPKIVRSVDEDSHGPAAFRAEVPPEIRKIRPRKVAIVLHRIFCFTIWLRLHRGPETHPLNIGGMFHDGKYPYFVNIKMSP